MKKIWRGLAEALLLALVAGMILAAGWYAAVVYSSEKAYRPDNLIRLHIIPNSDSELDQEIKIAVRDSLLQRIAPQLTKGDGGPLENLQELLPAIEETAREVIRARGAGYGAHPEIGIFRFPETTYVAGERKAKLPEGNYLALRVILGEGKGRNWWCVIFPPLCYLDVAVNGDVAPNYLNPPQPESALKDIEQGKFSFLIDRLPEEVRTEVRFYLADLLKAGRDAVAGLLARFRERVYLCPSPQ